MHLLNLDISISCISANHTPSESKNYLALNQNNALSIQFFRALFLSPRYQLFSEATLMKIVGTEGTIKVLLPEYQVNHISWIFLNHSYHWFELNDVYNGMILSPSNRRQMSISIQKRTILA
jgi:hypothetical protein